MGNAYKIQLHRCSILSSKHAFLTDYLPVATHTSHTLNKAMWALVVELLTAAVYLRQRLLALAAKAIPPKHTGPKHFSINDGNGSQVALFTRICGYIGMLKY